MRLWNRRSRRSAVLLGVTLCAVLAGTLSAAPAPEAQAAPAAAAVDPFYTPPSPLPDGEPGDVIRAERTSVFLDPAHLLSPPADAWRVMYLSESGTGERVAVTGTLLVPRAPWLGRGERPLLSYAVGSHGMGPQCMPSAQFHAGTQYEFALINVWLLVGWAVFVTDYEHVGTSGHEVYVNSRSAGQSMLDGARAATGVTGSGIDDANPLAITGYSQGGNAAAAAAERQPSYAPELDLKAVAAGGVPADLRATASAVDRDVLAGTLPMTVGSLAAVYPELTLDGFNATGRAAVAEVKTQCIAETSTRWAFHSSTELTEGGKTIDEFLDDNADWAKRVEEQRVGRLRPGVPVLLYHGALDPWVPYAVGKRLADDWRGQGADVTFTTYPIAEHFGGLGEAIPQVQTWLLAQTTGSAKVARAG